MNYETIKKMDYQNVALWLFASFRPIGIIQNYDINDLEHQSIWYLEGSHG